jgi:metallophosphoesterase (TIGR00282 family)
VLTTGDHIWKKREIIPYLDSNHHILRPANYPEQASGRGYLITSVRETIPVAVINLQGRIFMPPIDCPFRQVEAILEDLRDHASVIVVDFHAEATSEKVAMCWYLDGRVSAVLGTHTHVPTADERINPGGTACITDLGMTGPHDSVIGRRTDRVLAALTTSMPFPFDVAKEDVRLSGAVVTVDPSTGRAGHIERIQVRL